MGLSDFFRRRRDRESALAAAAEIRTQGGSASVQDQASGQVVAGAQDPPPLAPPGSQAGEPDWTHALGGLPDGQVDFSHWQGSVDLRNVEGLRADVLKALSEHGVDPSHPGAVDASQVQGLQESISQAFKTHGIDLAALSGMAAGAMSTGPVPAGGPGVGDAADVSAKLKELDQLRAQGALTDEEYRNERQKVLDQL